MTGIGRAPSGNFARRARGAERTRSPPEDRQNVIAFMPDSMYALSTDAVPSPLGCAQPPRTARKIDHLSAEWILSLLDEFHGIKAFVATKGAAA
jgi:hypothetical protein